MPMGSALFQDRDGPRMDERPFRATAVLVGASVAWNAWTWNVLWLWYAVLGLGVVLVAWGLARAGRLRVSPAAAWLIGLTLALHYGGGSLSGLHRFGSNGLYYAFPWWDNVVHALGSAAIALAVASALRQVQGLRRWHVIVLSIGVASMVGVLVELYEFANFLVFDTVDQGYYTNTVLDLYDNLLGGVAGGLLATARFTAPGSDAIRSGADS